MTISNVLKEGVSIGLKNFLSLVGACILYILTIWIPYLNVGTTIAMATLPAALSRGEVISPMEILDAKYRKNMGNFFLLSVLMSLGILIGFMFMIIPGIILAYSWSLAILLLVDKGLNPMQALNESNTRTYGHKWTIFFSFIVLGFGYFGISLLISLIGSDSSCMVEFMNYGVDYFTAATICTSWWASVLHVVLMLLYFPIQLGVMAVIYRTLGSDTPAVSNEG